jgi:hypothetical protein
MKIKVLRVLAGIGAPLILTPTAHADFTGVSVTAKANAFDLYVVNVYAEFDDPLQGGRVKSVAGTPVAPMNINVVGGEFYNHQFGTDKAPGTALITVFPSLAYDSFFTIGIKSVAAGQVNALNLVNMPFLAGTSVGTTNGSWGLVPPTAPQGNAYDPINCFPGDGRVLIGQFSLVIPESGPYGVTGEFLIGMFDNETTWIEYISFSSIVPGPGALGLIGLAGLASTRRRR